MKKCIKKASVLLLLWTCIINVVSGCSNKLTPGKLMSAVTENLSGVTSVSNSLDMYIELEEVLNSTKISMDMEMENTTKPMAGYARGNAQVDMSGNKGWKRYRDISGHRGPKICYLQQHVWRVEQGSIQKP